MKIHRITALILSAALLSACSANQTGVFKTDRPLPLSHNAVSSNLNQPFHQFIQAWFPQGAVNQSVNHVLKALNYISTTKNSGLEEGERLETYSANDSNGNSKQIIQKATETFQTWCKIHSGTFGNTTSLQDDVIEQALESKHNPENGMYFNGKIISHGCILHNQVIASLSYTQGQVRGISGNTFPHIALFAKDWNISK